VAPILAVVVWGLVLGALSIPLSLYLRPRLAVAFTMTSFFWSALMACTVSVVFVTFSAWIVTLLL
jgi:hypothetical protein